MVAGGVHPHEVALVESVVDRLDPILTRARGLALEGPEIRIRRVGADLQVAQRPAVHRQLLAGVVAVGRAHQHGGRERVVDGEAELTRHQRAGDGFALVDETGAAAESVIDAPAGGTDLLERDFLAADGDGGKRGLGVGQRRGRRGVLDAECAVPGRDDRQVARDRSLCTCRQKHTPRYGDIGFHNP